MKNMSSVISLIESIEHTLRKVYDDPVLCNQYAWWILEKITNSKQIDLLVHAPILSDAQQQQLNEYLDALTNDKKPLQYLLGSVPFNDVDIIVKPPILIPRPETEEWCVNLITQLKTLPQKPLSILDLCSGSGCIAIALGKALPHTTIVACDISPKAIELIQENIHHNNVTNVSTLLSDLFEQLPPGSEFDMIVSNPPYIAPEKWGSLDESVTAWEDRQALIADDHGLAILKKIIKHAPRFIQPNTDLQQHHLPQIMLEIDHKQGKAIEQIMHHRQLNAIQIHKDLEGNDRVVSARVDHVAISEYQS